MTGLSKKEMAALAGVSRETIRRWRKRLPSPRPCEPDQFAIWFTAVRGIVRHYSYREK